MPSWAVGEIEPLTAVAWGGWRRGGPGGGRGWGAGPAGRASQKPPPSTPCCELEQNSGAVKGLVLADFKEEAAYKLVPFVPPTPQPPQYTHLSQGLGSWPPLAFHLLWLSVCLRLSEHVHWPRLFLMPLIKVTLSLARESFARNAVSEWGPVFAVTGF